MATSQKLNLLLLVFLFFCLSGNGVYAFGAGNIPSYGYLKGKAFRHGDIEEIIKELFKRHGVKVGMFGSLMGKHKFSPMDVKRIYFGNWLRDFSQAMDISTLKKAPWQSIITIVVVLGFMSHGYATEEFEVTRERLGVYLPVQHIDNPKGYGEGKDPREVDPGLRPPIQPEESEIDPKTGMKNYIANDSGTWDTSKAYVRRTLERCIELGRIYRSSGDHEKEKYEAFRLLGAALHTLEDFTAHSNFCELCLVSMGHTEVFSHVGDAVRVQAPDGRMVAPVVTGVFGSDDFMHSLFSEGTDRISESSLSDVNDSVVAAHQKKQEQGNSLFAAALKAMLSKSLGATGEEISNDIDEIEKIGEDNKASAEGHEGKTKPEHMTPQELHQSLWKILSLRDKIVKSIDRAIEKVLGLRPLLNKVNDEISIIVFVALGPILGPLMRFASTNLQGASHEVISNHDQCEVFDNPHASDPTHSFLSKDHFTNILNQPAGNVAKIVVSHTIGLVVHAWDDKNLDVTKTIDEITECLFHPDFYDGKSKVQAMMLGYMHEWIEEFGHKKKSVLERLTKESVREHMNVLQQGEAGVSEALQNPLGLPRLEDLKEKLPPRDVKSSSVVGTYQGKPIYFSPEMYGRSGSSYTSPVATGTTPQSSYAPPQSTYAPPQPPSRSDSEFSVSSQDQQAYMWSAGLAGETVSFVSQSTEDFYSSGKSSSLPVTTNPFNLSPGLVQSTEDFYSAGPDPQRPVTAGYSPPQLGVSQSAQEFYSFPEPAPFHPHDQVQGSSQQPDDKASKNPFIRRMGMSPQHQPLGMDFNAQGSQQGPQPPPHKYLPPQSPPPPLQRGPQPPRKYLPPQSPPPPPRKYLPPPGPPPPSSTRRGQQLEDREQADLLAALAASLRDSREDLG